MMRAVVIHEAGGPEVLKLESRSIPAPKLGDVLIRIRAFGINRSEMFTRQGHSPVQFPRILGIEATGIVEEAPGGEFKPGDIVATAMGGMGRNFDGGYAEYTSVPATQVQVVKTKVPWEVLGALPEMLQTAWGALFKTLQIQKGDTLLIRGGTTSVGLAAAAIAKKHGVFVASTTRRADREKFLRDRGIDDVFIDNGTIARQVKERYPDGFDKILECLKLHGITAMTGIVGGKWTFEEFSPNMVIPTGTYLSTYGGSAEDFVNTPLDELVKDILDGTMDIPVGKVFKLEDIVEAHRCMDSNEAGGKIVVLT
ncbi:Quinone oxidoreductase [Lachnellula hyalina]|uniref:Quinone oxidoreductase n=1 Tax=Lachnellula hyalina TaxID=1316788 RepID=A0A8H8QXG6_9HELO|nr:Quinone oxidoreductase [Lachnellula hyalina]TVY24539.1 Quinone oxidoreductase [Lachnellula hyalina]